MSSWAESSRYRVSGYENRSRLSVYRSPRIRISRLSYPDLKPWSNRRSACGRVDLIRNLELLSPCSYRTAVHEYYSLHRSMYHICLVRRLVQTCTRHIPFPYLLGKCCESSNLSSCGCSVSVIALRLIYSFCIYFCSSLRSCRYRYLYFSFLRSSILPLCTPFSNYYPKSTLLQWLVLEKLLVEEPQSH